MGTIREEISSMEKVVDIDYSPVTINRYKNVLRKLETFVPRFMRRRILHSMNFPLISSSPLTFF